MQQLLTNALDNHIKKLDVSWSYAEYPLNGAILCIENATGNIVGDVRKRDTDPKRIDFRHAHTEQ